MVAVGAMAALVAVLSGCGAGGVPAPKVTGSASDSAQPDPSARIRVEPGHHEFRLAELGVGSVVTCGLAKAGIPAPGHAVSASADGVSTSADLRVVTRANGSITVECDESSS